MNAQATQRFLRARAEKLGAIFKTRVDYPRIFRKASLMEIAMPSASRKARCIGAASSLAASCWAGTALASQGPGTGMGTAGHFLQLAMAVLVYGISALVVGAGLIGAIRRH